MAFGRFFTCLLLLSSLGFVRTLAWAQPQVNGGATACHPLTLERIGKHFGLGDFAYPRDGMYPSAENGGLIVAGACKSWGANNARTLAAFAYDAGIQYQKTLVLAVTDASTHRVLAAYRGDLPEDAASEVTHDALRLDTARYALSQTTRAFGLRVDSFRDHCAFEGGFNDELTLFVVEGKTLRPVLTETLSHWSYGPGNRCGGEAAPRTDAQVVISVEPTSSNGFADLKLTATRSDKKKPVSAIVRYDGERYDLKPWKKAFGAWWE